LQYGVLLNITPDHLEHHGSLDNYVQAKIRLFSLLRPGGKCIVGVDSALSASVYDAYKQTHSLIPISTAKPLKKGLYWENETVVDTYFSKIERTDFSRLTRLQGQHNAQNVLAAFALCRLMAVPVSVIQDAVLSFQGLSHRQEVVGRFKDVMIVNDSKATNVDSLMTALAVFDEIWLFLGGKMKTGDALDPILKYKHKIKRIYAFGEGKTKVNDFFEQRIPVVVSPTLKKATAVMLRDLETEKTLPKIVLFSPASASFDEFNNYEERGDFFKQLVRAKIAQEDKARSQQ